MTGWIKLHRSFVEWEWFDDHNTSRLFIYLLMKANHAPKRWRGFVIQRGQHHTSLEQISRSTGLTVSQVRTSIKKLKTTGEITDKSQAGGRMITISAYDTYQANDKPDSTCVAGESQEDRTKQECKEVEKVKKRDSTPYQAIVDSYHERLPSLPEVVKLSAARKTKIKARWISAQKEGKDINYFHGFFDYVSQSTFMTTQLRGCNLEWLMTEGNFLKTIEGNYHDNT
jgi:biotin operon repressor